MSKNVGKKMALGAILAGAVGYLAGILTAPKSGKETRKDIKDTANRFVRDAEKKLKVLHTELNNLISQANELISKEGGKVRVGLNRALTTAKIHQKKVKEVISAVRNGETDHPELEKAIKEATKAKNHLAKYFKNR